MIKKLVLLRAPYPQVAQQIMQVIQLTMIRPGVRFDILFPYVEFPIRFHSHRCCIL